LSQSGRTYVCKATFGRGDPGAPGRRRLKRRLGEKSAIGLIFIIVPNMRLARNRLKKQALPGFTGSGAFIAVT
jgi:hypothetical protein